MISEILIKAMPRIVLFASILALFAGCLVLPACSNSGNAINDPVSPIYVEFSFPKGLPSINEAKELQCLVKTADRDTENVEITINLPDGLQLVSGNLSAEYAAMSKNDVKELLATIEPVRYDDYTIEVKFSCGSKYTYSGMFNIYLSNIDLYNIDGPTWWDIFPINRKGLSERWLPAVKLYLPYAPAVNQMADLTCVIFSNSDIEDAKVVIESSRRYTGEAYVDVTRPYVKGETISSTLNLKTNGVVSFSSKTVFKETGLWEINAHARGAYDDTIYLTVGSNKGEIGWPLPPRPKLYEDEIPPPPAIPLDRTGYQ
jgi:hypothetical protein